MNAETKNILLVEDDIITGMAEKCRLEEEGYCVTHIQDGEQALQAVATEHFDLVLMDVDLGLGMDGPTAAEAILQKRDVPILFLSGHTEREVVEKTERITSYGYVVKGADDTVLLASIKMAFKLHAATATIKKREQELLRANHQLALAQRAARAGVWDWDVRTGHIEWSPEMFTLFGLDRDNATASFETWRAALHPEDLRDAEANILRALDEQSFLINEYRIVLPGGETRWISALGQATFAGEGRPARMSGICIDITERKQAEAVAMADMDALACLQKLGTLFVQKGDLGPVLGEVVDAAIAIAAADFGNIQLLDPAAGQLRIVAQRGLPPWWLDYWDKVGKGQGTCGSALQLGERIIVEDVERSPIFAGRPALDIQLQAGIRAVQSTPLVSRSGRSLGMFSTHYRKPHRPDERTLRLLDMLARHAADIIDRAQMDAALHQSEELYRALFDHMLNGMAYCQMHFDEQDNPVDFTYLAVNKAFETLTGLQGVKGRRVSEVVPGIQSSDFRLFEIYGRVARGGPPESFEMYVAPLKNWFYVSAYCPNPGYFAAVFDVITERKLVEQALQKALQEKDLLMRELQHRTKNNITMIRSFLQLHANANANPEARRTLRDAINFTQSIALMYQQLSVSGTSTTVDLGAYLKSIGTAFTRDGHHAWPRIEILVEAEHIEISTKQAVTVGIILNELLTNAFKHAFAGADRGTVGVRLQRSGDDIELRVTDDGRAFPDDLDFSNVSSTGLSLVNMLVLQLDGRMEFRTTPEKRISMRFPCSEVSDDPHVSADQGEMGGNETMLLRRARSGAGS